MREHQLLSVVVPCYNEEAVLHEWLLCTSEAADDTAHRGPCSASVEFDSFTGPALGAECSDHLHLPVPRSHA